MLLCTVEKANVVVNRLIEEGRLNELGLVVLDEVHLLAEEATPTPTPIPTPTPTPNPTLTLTLTLTLTPTPGPLALPHRAAQRRLRRRGEDS